MRTTLLGLAFAAWAQASQVTFTNTRRLLFDVDGNQIDAYGSKVQSTWNTHTKKFGERERRVAGELNIDDCAGFNGSYYLYGNSFAIQGVAFGIKSYSSVDLEHWYACPR